MIKYLETTEKYTYRGYHEILELYCIFTLKSFPCILTELKNLYLSGIQIMVTHLT